ncbi:MAG: 50S ribosomal protein L16 [Candidatus Hydrothermarchaeaceae archaeon]
MAKKPGSIYRSPKNRSYTRKEYMGGIPISKITIFDMGDVANSSRFPVELSLRAKEHGQMTHNAMEAARIAANRYLSHSVGRSGFHLKFKLYPHEVLRENKQATGAGADRVSDGMRRAFGKAVSLGAKANKGQEIITVRVNPQHYSVAKDALRRAASKLPMPYSITIEKGRELLKL